MHELSITQSLVNTVLQVADERKAKKISIVSIVMGEGFDYVPEVIQEYFEMLSEGSVAEGCRLHFETKPVKIYCARCDKEYEGRSLSTIRCIHCGSADIKVLSGKEFQITSMEIEE